MVLLQSEVLDLFEKRGYRFISLDEALSREQAYQAQAKTKIVSEQQNAAVTAQAIPKS